MIDLHCHILPGIDDGSSSMSESLEMARIAFSDGIKALIATPHVFENSPSIETIKNKADELKKAVKKQGINLKIATGAELSYPVSIENPSVYGLNGTKNILVEFPHHYLPINSTEYIKSLLSKGLYPIIAHPERNMSLLKNPSRLFDLVAEGASVQLTSSSITGDFGKEIQALSLYLIKKKVVHFVASDSHGAKTRRPELSKAMNLVEKLTNKKNALQLFVENPLKVLEGQRVIC